VGQYFVKIQANHDLVINMFFKILLGESKEVNSERMIAR
jgi:hypothetical protein